MQSSVSMAYYWRNKTKNAAANTWSIGVEMRFVLTTILMLLPLQFVLAADGNELLKAIDAEHVQQFRRLLRSIW